MLIPTPKNKILIVENQIYLDFLVIFPLDFPLLLLAKFGSLRLLETLCFQNTSLRFYLYLPTSLYRVLLPRLEVLHLFLLDIPHFLPDLRFTVFLLYFELMMLSLVLDQQIGILKNIVYNFSIT